MARGSNRDLTGLLRRRAEVVCGETGLCPSYNQHIHQVQAPAS